jgi:hypothetical protein
MAYKTIIFQWDMERRFDYQAYQPNLKQSGKILAKMIPL